MKKWTAAIYLAVAFGVLAGSGIACGASSGCMSCDEDLPVTPPSPDTPLPPAEEPSQVPEGEIIDYDVGGVFDAELIGETMNHEEEMEAEIGENMEIPVVFVQYDGQWHKAFPWVTCGDEKVEVGGRGTRFFVDKFDDYTITYYIEVSGPQEVLSTTVSVVDTKGPKFNLPASADGMLVYKDKEVTLPDWTATDFSEVDGETEISVTFDGEEVEVVDGKFTPTEFGNYTVTYTAYDMEGNETTETFTIECARMVELCDFDDEGDASAWQYYNGRETLGVLSEDYRYGNEGSSLKVVTPGTGEGGFIKVAINLDYYQLGGFDEIAFTLWASEDLTGIYQGIYLLNNQAYGNNPINVKKGENVIRISMAEFSRDYADGDIMQPVANAGNKYNSSDHLWLQFRGPDGVELYIDNVVGVFGEMEGEDTVDPLVDLGAGAAIKDSKLLDDTGAPVPDFGTYEGAFGNISLTAGETIQSAIDKYVHVCDNSMGEIDVTYKVTKNNTNVALTTVGVEGETYVLTVTATDEAGNSTTKSCNIVVRHKFPVYNPTAEGYTEIVLNDFSTAEKLADATADSATMRESITLSNNLNAEGKGLEMKSGAEYEAVYLPVQKGITSADVQKLEYINFKILNFDAGLEFSIGDKAIKRSSSGWNNITLDRETLLYAIECGAYNAVTGTLKINLYCPFALPFKFIVDQVSVVYLDENVPDAPPSGGDEEDEPTELTAPVVTLNDNVASWTAVDNATSYIVSINGVESTTTETSVELADGETVKVKAVGNGTTFTDSAWSNEETYTAPSGGDEEDEPTQLTAPVVTLNDNVASWTAVDNATSYIVSINGVESTTTETSVELADGETVKVKAVGNGTTFTDSAWSNEETYTAPSGGDEEDEPTQLTAPVVTLNGNVASWTAVDNATGYVVSINGVESTMTETSIELVANETIKVKAVGNGTTFTDSVWSNEETYTVSGGETEATQLAMPVVSLNGNVASWTWDDNADAYEYKIGESGTPVETWNEEVTLNDGDTIFVRAIGDGVNFISSEWSQGVTFTATQLAAPVVSLNGNVATWEAVDNASAYTYVINNIENTTVTPIEITLNNGETLKVKAISTNALYKDGDWSNEVTFTAQKLNAPVLVRTLKKVTWDAIEIDGVEVMYVYQINDGNETPTNVREITLEEGQTLKVKAVGAGAFVDSDWATITFTLRKLDTPVLVRDSENSNIITWAPVEGAVGYKYTFDQAEINVLDFTGTELKWELTRPGELFKIYAVGDGQDTKNSDWCEFVEYESNATQLATPMAWVENGLFVWTESTGASNYVISVDGVETTVAGTVMSFALSASASEIKVKAIGDGVQYLDSEWSNSESYTKPANALATPQLSIDENLVTWVSIENASGYEYSFDGGVTIAGTIDANGMLVVSADYNQSVQVRAIGDNVNYTASAWSSAVTNDTIYVLNRADSVDESYVNGAPARELSTQYTKDGKSIHMSASTTSAQWMTINLTMNGTPVTPSNLNMLTAIRFDVYNAESTAVNLFLSTRQAKEDGTALAPGWNTVYIPVATIRSEIAANASQLDDLGNFFMQAVGNVYFDNFVGIINDGSLPAVETPVLTISGNAVTWGAVANAAGYEYSFDGGVTVAGTTTATSLTLTAGQSVQVRAIGDNVSYASSDWSVAVSYVTTETRVTLNALNATADVASTTGSNLTTSTLNSVDGTSIAVTADVGNSFPGWYIPLRVNGAIPTLAQLGGYSYIELTIYTEFVDADADEEKAFLEMYRTQVAPLRNGKNVIRIPGAQFVEIANTWEEVHGDAKAYDEETGVVNFNIFYNDSSAVRTIYIDNLVAVMLPDYVSATNTTMLNHVEYGYTIQSANVALDYTTFIQGTASVKVSVNAWNYINVMFFDYDQAAADPTLGGQHVAEGAWMSKTKLETFAGGVSFDVYNACDFDVTLAYNSDGTPITTLKAKAWTKVTLDAATVAARANAGDQGHFTFCVLQDNVVLYFDNVVGLNTAATNAPASGETKTVLNNCDAYNDVNQIRFWVESNLTATLNTTDKTQGNACIQLNGGNWTYFNVYMRDAGDVQLTKAQLLEYDEITIDMYNAGAAATVINFSDEATAAVTLEPGQWTTVTFNKETVSTWFGEGYCTFRPVSNDGTVALYIDNVVGVKNA